MMYYNISSYKMQTEMSEFRRSLPIFQYKASICQSVASNDFLIVTGDTGSGKSTQLPQYMMDSPEIKESIIANRKNIPDFDHRPIDSVNVIITQPRRMAAVSMANRVSQERGTVMG